MSQRCLGCMELFGDEFEICPHCGYIVGTQAEEAIHMEPGTLLYDRYIIGRVLGYGGFGVTYLGWDGKLEQKVAIKEYLPSEFSTRMPGQSQVTVFNGDKSEQFREGLKKFVEEAKRLAKFQNEPGIVKIFDSFEENDTAYIVMEYLEGETLASYLKREKKIPEDQAVAMLTPIMESLQAVHAEGLLHRDIAPDNVFLLKSGEVKLIDFGASRYATTSHSRSLTVIIKPGYSPEEQYRSRGDQGPYTDVYALAATLYKMITGKTPPDAMERRAKYETQNKDILEEPHKIEKTISVSREIAILNAMNVRIEDRTPDVATFMKELNADPPAKRIYGKIKKIDLYAWPMWLKVAVPSVLACLLVFTTLLLTGVIDFSRFTETIVVPEGIATVPDVEGESTEEAVRIIENARFLAVTGGTVSSEYIPAGTIVLQTPVGGSYLDINGSVILTVSSGSGVQNAVDGVATVPYVIWDEQAAAVAKLRQAGLGEPIIEEAYDENVTPGHVIAQSVEVGQKVDEGTVLTLKVSLGPTAFAMPDVAGQDFEAAKAELTARGLVVTAEYQKDNTVPDNRIIRQSVEAGTMVKRGDSVMLIVSSGKKTIEVANVVGRTTGDATDILKKQGFQVIVLENYDTEVEAGRVISQTPAGGTYQIEGSSITIYVSKGKAQITVGFNGNGGTASRSSGVVRCGSAYGELPGASRTGYEFLGWFTASSGGTRVTDTTRVTATAAHTLYAHWSVLTYTLKFDPNGGVVATESRTVAYGSAYGELPAVSRDYYSFQGWFTKTGAKVSSSTTMGAENATLYAHWEPTALSDWVRAETVPEGARVEERKWVYTKTETKESVSGSVSDWTLTGSYWKKTGSGSSTYASFPSGFHTDSWYYKNFEKSPYAAYENSVTKREVSNAWAGYIYWHWIYDTGQSSASAERAILDKCGWGVDGYYYQYFYAFNSTKGDYNSDTGHCNALGLRNYIIPDQCTSYAESGGAARWFRFDFYTSTYTDYLKYYQYKRVTEGRESSTEISNGGQISNVQCYVRYRPK